jgi:hypothetical protein
LDIFRAFLAELRCQDVREFRETEGLAAQRLICAGTPVGIAFENQRPVRSESHVRKWRDYETAGRHRNEPRHVVPARQALLEAGQKRDTGSNGRADRRFLRTVQRAYASTPDAQKKRRLIKWRSERIAALIAQGLDDREIVAQIRRKLDEWASAADHP